MKLLALVLILIGLQAQAQSSCPALFSEAPTVANLAERLTSSSFAIGKKARAARRDQLHADVDHALESLLLADVKLLARTAILSPRKALSLTDWQLEHRLLMGYLARIETAEPTEIREANAGVKDWLALVNEANPSTGVTTDEQMKHTLGIEYSPRLTEELEKALEDSIRAGELLTSSELDYLTKLLEVHLFDKMNLNKPNLTEGFPKFYEVRELTQRPRFRALVKTIIEFLREDDRDPATADRLEADLPTLQ